MIDAHAIRQSPTYWFVGAYGAEDHTDRFLEYGLWENGYDRKYTDQVRSMLPGDRIAIKSSYTRKHNLPFDNQGRAVSVMAIKAMGLITKNLNDGKRVRVTWTRVDPPREWYFFTHRSTIWKVQPGEPATDALLSFTFEGKPQNISFFQKTPNMQDQSANDGKPARFSWVPFYESIADKLLDHRKDRRRLIQGIHAIGERLPNLKYLQDRFPDGRSGPLEDICPFTAMGTFNRTITDANRISIATAIGGLLGVSTPPPDSFDGIPILNNMASWFFGYSTERGERDIETLWDVFEAAHRFVESEQSQSTLFIDAYDRAIQLKGVKWNLSTGLYWSHPSHFATLDSQSRQYVRDKLRLSLARGAAIDGRSYLALLDKLQASFSQDSYPVHSFPELSFAAWISGRNASDDSSGPGVQPPDTPRPPPEIIPPPPPPVELYSAEAILRDGCFLDRSEIERLLDRLEMKKNLILQGPPGTGKTWLARRLAFALMGEKNDRNVRVVQFHPNLSYEDFVRGWRPTGNGTLALVDGIFMEAIQAAINSPATKVVVVIEEINRGNPAHIFGELLTLLEAGKRSPSDAIEVCYPDPDGQKRPVYVPENLYVVGTMNIADRSLALVDLALRRRFAFATLAPRFGDVWRSWVVERGGVDPELASDIERRIETLNQRIAESLGAQFQIGHSYVTPVSRLEAGSTRDWFLQVVETEVGPLLEEYWFDSPKEAELASARLTAGW